MAAAFEGRLLGLPAIALSLGSRELRFAAAEAFVRDHLVRWLEDGLPPDTLLNVNIPSGEPEDVRGIRPCRLGSRRYSDADIEMLRRIQDLTNDGLNLAGVKRVMALEAEVDVVIDNRGFPHIYASNPADAKGVATRAASGTVLNAIATPLPELVGGSADLGPPHAGEPRTVPGRGSAEALPPDLAALRRFTDAARKDQQRFGRNSGG